MAEARQGSILAADFGSVTTRVTLVDVVDGEYRLVARSATGTTAGYPIADVSIGLQRVLRDLGASSGRTFFDKNNNLITPERGDRSGVDFFVTTASAGRPVRAVVVGLMPDISILSALRAISGAYVEVAAMLHLKDGLTEEERLNAVLLTRPDLIFVAGGTEGGAETALLNILKVVQLALRLTDTTQRPNIIYAGNSRIAPKIRELFSELTGLFVADNVRPAIDDEAFESAQLEMGRVYDVHKERHGEGFNQIGRMSSTGVLPTAQSYTLIAEYFDKLQTGNIIALDMGSSTTVLVGVFNSTADTNISTNLGTGHSAPNLVETVGQQNLDFWLPFYPQPGEIANYALHKALHPATIPMTLRDLYIEHAFVRAGIRHLVDEARHSWTGVEKTGVLPAIDMIIAGGAPLTGTGNPAHNLMLIVDSVRPTGITDVVADPHGMVAALGAMARVNPEAVVQLLDGDQLEHLGTVITVTGEPQTEKIAIKFRLKTEDGEIVKSEIKGGHLLLLPVSANETVEIDIRLSRGLTVNGQRRIKRKFRGGTAGVLFDVRGRPLQTGEDVAERAVTLARWLHEATDNPLEEIPADWLEEPVVEAAPLPLLTRTMTGEVAAVAAPAPRRGLFGRRGAAQPAAANGAPAGASGGTDDDDEFMRLLEDDSKPPSKTGKKQTSQLDEDIGSLRELL
jgi:uncharacterized protein (TIGR01319 family)